MLKSVWKKLLLIVGGLVVGLLLAEMILAVLSTAPGRRLTRKPYREEGDGSLHMAVLGGSTANGFPYSEVLAGASGRGFNLLTVTAYLLQERVGISGVTTANYSGPNWSAETAVQHYLERPGRKPDVVVLYTGQNETTRYYSPNMIPPPTYLSPLAYTRPGSLLLRWLFTRQVVGADQRYTGTFFSENIIPAYERQHNLHRFRRHVGQLIRHTRSQGILLVLVIPQGNYLLSPTRSVYDGPAARKAEALDGFKRAWEARTLENDPEKAFALLQCLASFCSFAHLHYELGRCYMERGDIVAARAALQRARATDAFPTSITPAYREVLRELAEKHEIPSIDMDQVIRARLDRPLPDFESLLDDCHLHPETYLALSQEIIQTLRRHDLLPGAAPGSDLSMMAVDWARIGITPAMLGAVFLREADYLYKHAAYTFCRIDGLRQVRRYLERIASSGPVDEPISLDADLALVDSVMDREKHRMRQWLAHDGALPVGAPPPGEVPEGFGESADIESSQGYIYLVHGEYALAVEHYRTALAMDPDHVPTHANLASALNNLGRVEEAIHHYRRSLELAPGNVVTRHNMARALLKMEQYEESLVQLREVVGAGPSDGEALRDYCLVANALAWRLSTSTDAVARNGARALILAEEVAGIAGKEDPVVLNTLAAACAESGRFKEAVDWQTRALERSTQHGALSPALLRQRLAAYEAGLPWREPSE